MLNKAPTNPMRTLEMQYLTKVKWDLPVKVIQALLLDLAVSV